MEVAMIAAAGLKAVGGVISGLEESQNLKATQQAAELSARYARDNAATELRLATADAEKQRREGRYAVGEQAAAFSQSGFSLTDTAVSSLEQSSSEAELDALNLQYKGVLRNRSSLIEAGNYDAQADAARRARKAMPAKIVIGAATNLLSGYANSQGARIS